MLSRYLPYPFGRIPNIKTSVSFHYDNSWQSWVIITWQEEDGFGLDWSEMPEMLKKEHLEARSFVEEMNGTYEYKPTKGEGCTITIKYKNLDLFGIGSKASFDEPLKLLLVDDEQQAIDLIYDIYSKKGFNVLEANDGEAAVEVFKKDNPQITIIDAHMPFSLIDGIETLRRIREINKQACCIVVTDIEEDKWSMQQAKELGVMAYFVKPFSKELFDAAITEAKGFLMVCKEVERRAQGIVEAKP